MTGSARLRPRGHVLVVGGGIAGTEALMTLADLGDHGLRLQLVASHSSFFLRPQTLGEPWGGLPLHIDLRRLCQAFGAQFVKGTVIEVDAAAHQVRTAAGDALGYERLLLAPGARLTLAYPNTRTLGFGSLPELLATSGSGTVAIVVPPGVSWTLPAYELALLTAASGRQVRVITGEAFPLEAFGPGTRAATRGMLDRHGVTVDTTGAPQAGTQVNDLADTVIALPLLRGPALGGTAGDDLGFIPVDSSMGLPGASGVYAAGDAARHRIKQGGLAAQQAETAAAEVVRSCGGVSPPIPYRPVLRGKLTAPGEELYLRRHLDGHDFGQADPLPLWQPSGSVCAWRLARWLSRPGGDAQPYVLDHVPQPVHA